MTKIAFDIATKNIGVAIIKDEKIKVGTIKINYNENKLLDIATELRNKINELLSPFFNDKAIIGLEVSNFGNPQTTQKFSLLAGIIIAIIESNWWNDVEIKTFNSNQWQHLIGCETKDTRDIRKAKSKDFFFKKTGIINTNDDETDAYCIAYHLEQLNSTLEQAEHIKKIKKNKIKTKEEIAKLNKQIVIKQKKLLKLKPTQIKLKERLENEIKDIENRISAIHGL